jgi:acetyl-CoA carboxylase carboxyltransferase component
VTDSLIEFRAQRDAIRSDLGGKDKIERVRSRGRRTIREHIDTLIDAGSFEELGTFVKSEVVSDRHKTPTDGVVGGFATVDGRPIVIAGHDETVMGGSDARNGDRKMRKLYHHALRARQPLVLFGAAGGGRIPDILGSESMTRGAGTGHDDAFDWVATRHRQIPMISAIVGRSYGQSSFLAALSDVVIQVSGTVLAITSPRVIETATSEIISEEDLGGRKVQETVTRQIDLGVDTDDDAIAAIRKVLSYLPSNCFEYPPLTSKLTSGIEDRDIRLATLVPADRRRAYDMRKVVRCLSDDGEFFELRPKSGQSTLTGFIRMDGRTAGVIASQPMHMAGAITPEGCDKMTRFVCLCDSFNIPIVTLTDSPGFLVGSRVEQDRLLFKGMMLQQALTNSQVPRITVILRKAFGLALHILSGPNSGASAVFSWPEAELSFMDPDVGANVLYGRELSSLNEPERVNELRRRAEELRRGTSAYGGAVHMGIDEIIDPEETAPVVRAMLSRLDHSFEAGTSVLRGWPTCW